MLANLDFCIPYLQVATTSDDSQLVLQVATTSDDSQLVLQVATTWMTLNLSQGIKRMLLHICEPAVTCFTSTILIHLFCPSVT